MNRKKVSVIVPVYNVEKYLKRCINSILGQSYSDFELILVDDGSTDKCPEICDTIKTSDPRIVVIHKKNGGLSSARNAGLDVASGQYICFIDSDDWIEDNYLENMLSFGEIRDDSIVVAGISIDFINDGICDVIQAKGHYSEKIMPIKNGVEALLRVELFNYAWNKLYSKKNIKDKEIRFEMGSEPAEDLVFNIKYFCEISSVCFADDAIYHYVRQDAQSMTNRYIPNMYEKAKEMNLLLRSFYLHFELLEGETYEKYLESYNYRLFACIPNLYRLQTIETKTERKRIFMDMIKSKELTDNLRKMKTSNIHLKIYKRLVLSKNVFFMDLLYSVLFFIRNRFTGIYKLIRKILREVS